MATISKIQAVLIAKAQQMMAGLRDKFLIFENPPIPHKELDQDITNYINVRDEEVSLLASLKAVRTKKTGFLTKLEKDYSKDKMYCEGVAAGNASILEMVGLSGPKEKKKASVPAQCGNFRVKSQRLDGAEVEWDRPLKDDGGLTKFFRIYRSSDNKVWVLDSAPSINKATIKSQGDGTTFSYRVVAVNNIGESAVSNEITLKF